MYNYSYIIICHLSVIGESWMTSFTFIVSLTVNMFFAYKTNRDAIRSSGSLADLLTHRAIFTLSRSTGVPFRSFCRARVVVPAACCRLTGFSDASRHRWRLLLYLYCTIHQLRTAASFCVRRCFASLLTLLLIIDNNTH